MKCATLPLLFWDEYWIVSCLSAMASPRPLMPFLVATDVSMKSSVHKVMQLKLPCWWWRDYWSQCWKQITQSCMSSWQSCSATSSCASSPHEQCSEAWAQGHLHAQSLHQCWQSLNVNRCCLYPVCPLVNLECTSEHAKTCFWRKFGAFFSYFWTIFSEFWSLYSKVTWSAHNYLTNT